MGDGSCSCTGRTPISVESPPARSDSLHSSGLLPIVGYPHHDLSPIAIHAAAEAVISGVLAPMNEVIHAAKRLGITERTVK